MASATALVLLAAEGALRLSGYDPFGLALAPDQIVIRSVDDSELAYELTPGFSGSAFGTVFEVNEYGFRGPAPEALPRAAGRVLVLGDSVAFGLAVEDRDTFRSQLDAQLAASGGPEVLSLAVPGYDTLQELRILQTKGINLDPDVVVVLFCLNDIHVVSTQLDDIERLRSARQNRLYRSRLAQFVARRIWRVQWRQRQLELDDPGVFRTTYAGRIDPIGDDETQLLSRLATLPDTYPSFMYRERERLGRMRHAFRRLAELGLAEGFDIVLGIVPWLEASSAGYELLQVHQIIADEAAAAGLRVVDPTDAMLKAGLENLRANPADVTHPNSAGHGIMAEVVGQFIVEQGLLERRNDASDRADAH